VFVTGQTGPDVRARSTLCGGNDFLVKPFVLTELALKALMMIVRTELRTAV
jgi:DNA-binding response OmpR family regulator